MIYKQEATIFHFSTVPTGGEKVLITTPPIATSSDMACREMVAELWFRHWTSFSSPWHPHTIRAKKKTLVLGRQCVSCYVGVGKLPKKKPPSGVIKFETPGKRFAFFFLLVWPSKWALLIHAYGKSWYLLSVPKPPPEMAIIVGGC